MKASSIRSYTLDDVKKQASRLIAEGADNPYVRQLASVAVAEAPHDDAGGQFVAVHEFVRRTFPYQPDAFGKEVFIAPARVAEDYILLSKVYSLDCDCMALLTAAMLRTIGYRTRFVALAIHGDEFDHAISQVYGDGEWISIDASSKYPTGWAEQYRKMVTIE